MKLNKGILIITIMSVFLTSVTVYAADTMPEISAPSALLMDYASGKIIYEKNADEKRPLASVTKIMTMLLAMEEIDSGRLKTDDIIIGSAHAKSYGGSTIFLDEGEQMTVSDIMKGIAVASGNDAAVAMGEHISGTEEAFVQKMNQRASELGMTNTHFVNCNGLDADNHYSTARDIAVMSRELMNHHGIFNYTGIWMDSLRNGEFTLSNTNKLIRFYDGATGLKTGSTNKAGFCISATAMRDGMHLIAVIMGAETSKARQSDASTMLDYGFATYRTNHIVACGDKMGEVNVDKGTVKKLDVVSAENYDALEQKDSGDKYTTKVNINNKIKAPINPGTEVGSLDIMCNDEVVARIKLVTESKSDKIKFGQMFKGMVTDWLN